MKPLMETIPVKIIVNEKLRYWRGPLRRREIRRATSSQQRLKRLLG